MRTLTSETHKLAAWRNGGGEMIEMAPLHLDRSESLAIWKRRTARARA